MENMSNVSIPKGRKNSLIIRTSTISMLLICFLMILPDDAFSIGSIYESLTPSTITYVWLNYKFGILQLFVLIIGIYEAIRLKKKSIFLVFIAMLIRELLILVFQNNSLFKVSAYEMYLTVAVGYAFVLWAEGAMESRQRVEQLFELFLVTNMLTLYINFAMGGAGGILTGRYHSSNLDVGGTGTVCVLCFLYFFLLADKKWYHYAVLILSIIGLSLSGSRANLLFLMLILMARAIYISAAGAQIKKKTSRRKFLNRLFVAIFLVAVGGLIVYTKQDEIIGAIAGSRFKGLFDLQAISSDYSFDGRKKSLQAGFDVLKSHPFGISGYFIDLQSEVQLRSYPTFPHSALLSMYLLFGPIILLVGYLWIKTLIMSRNKPFNRYFWILLYMLISSTIYGAPITNFKLIFVYAMITRLAYAAVLTSNGRRAVTE